MFSVPSVLRPIIVLCLFLASSVHAETLQEYAKRCADYVGASVPSFNCQSGSLIPIDGPEGNDGRCSNRALLNGKCFKYGRLGKIQAGPDVEIRFLCRHYSAASGPTAEGYDDIAVIQQNTKTGATCFYQSPVGRDMKAFVNSPEEGEGGAFKLSELNSCHSCHDNRGFIGTPFLKGVTDANAIPAPKKMVELFFPGETTASWSVSKVEATGNPLCSNCHDMGNLGSSHDLGQKSLDIAQFMGLYNGSNSYEAHKACADNPNQAGCRVLTRRHASEFPRPRDPVITNPNTGICQGSQWFSREWNRCFEKGNRCEQYNGTNQGTCETPNDSLACDWNESAKSCFAEVKKVECNDKQWFSAQYNTCFEKFGRCEQYSGRDAKTCESPNDSLACDWDANQNTCFAEGAAKNLPRNGAKVEIVSRNSDKCLDVAGNSKENGASLHQWACGGAANQKYTLEDMGKGEWRLHPSHSAKCVSIAEESAADGAKVHQWDCDGGTNQRFRLTPSKDGSFKLNPVHSGKCLSVAGESKDNGAKVHQWNCDGGSNQDWRLRE